MINARTIFLFLIISAFAAAVYGQSQQAGLRSASPAAGPPNSRFMPLTEIKEGMRGTALTVFKGSEAEPFNVEILGVLPGGVGPKQDLIVGRISGGNADRTAVFAGMSGSPVYVDGRLIGAISYSFPFSKEAICGITPIEQMISIFEEGASGRKTAVEAAPISFAEIASGKLATDLPRMSGMDGSLVSGISADSLLMAVAGQTFRPIGTPVTFTGIHKTTLDLFAPQLIQAGLVPVASVGGSAAITPLKKAGEDTLQGGSSVSMHLTRGDYSLAAAGTVTLRDGDKIYAFGHPFLSLGTADLPMSESSVITVIPSVNNSFKLAVPQAMVGTMTQDRATGVFGTLGRAPKMIPVKLTVETSRGQTDTIDFEIARDEFLTPLLLNITMYNSLVAQERTIGETTVLIDGAINIAGQAPIKLQRRFAGGQSSVMAAGSVAGPVSALLKSRFEDLDISGIDLTLKTIDGSNTAALERIAIDRTEVRAGETVEVQAFARTASGRVFVQRIPVTIPVGTPEGELTVRIGDGGAIHKTDPIQQFVPSDLTDLVSTINRIKVPDRLYVKVLRTADGVIVGSSEMPNLPPSVLATLNNDRTAGGMKSAKQSAVTEQEIAPADFLISGEQSLKITVIR